MCDNKNKKKNFTIQRHICREIRIFAFGHLRNDAMINWKILKKKTKQTNNNDNNKSQKKEKKKSHKWQSLWSRFNDENNKNCNTKRQ